MNPIFDTKALLLKSKVTFYNEQYEFAMNSNIDRLNNRHKIHWILLQMYKRQLCPDASFYPVHVVIFHDRGEHTERVESFLSMFHLCRWQGIGEQKDERLAYQGWVNGYGMKAITVEGLVSGIIFCGMRRSKSTLVNQLLSPAR